MPEVPRFGWRVLLVSTALAALAAAATVVILDGGDDDTDPTGTITLEPDQGQVDPAQVNFAEFDGTEVALSSLRGRPVVVNFFASTCVPCITEMPDFETVHRERGEEVVFLGLAVADRVDAAQDLVERTGVTYRTAQDRDGTVIAALGGQLLPTTAILDADGTVLAVHSGALDADELRALLDAELGPAR